MSSANLIFVFPALHSDFHFFKIVFMTISLVPVPKQQGTLKSEEDYQQDEYVCLEDDLSTCKLEKIIVRILV